MRNDNPNNGGWRSPDPNQNQYQNGYPNPNPNQNQYPNGYPYTTTRLNQTSITERTSLAQKVMVFTCFSIVAAVAGVWVGNNALHLRYGGANFLIFIAFFGLSIATSVFRNVNGLNFILLYSFAFSSGLMISPLIYLMSATGQSSTIYEALFVTAGVTLALTFYAWFTQRDFTGFAPYLFAALIALILVGLLNIFLNSPMLHTVYLFAGVTIFSCWLVFDVQRMRKYRDTMGNAIIITIEIYLDILNLFLIILRILSRR
jgi:modulator of FtsH protease